MSLSWKKIRTELADFNPWPRIRIMHTNVVPDILSGITVAFIALPLALGFGVASGLGAIAGMYGAIAGGLFGGLFGGSNVGVSGPTGPKTVQLALILQEHRLPDGTPDVTFAFGCVLLSGIIMIALAFMKVGRFIYYTPYSVISGFMCAIGAILLIQQFRPFIGLPILPDIKEAFVNIPSDLFNLQVEALVVSLVTLGILLTWPRYVKAAWLPSPLIALLAGTLLAQMFHFSIPYIPEVPTGLPSLHIPSIDMVGAMFVPAAALAGLAVYDSLLTCIVLDQKTAERHNSDQEIFGQGVANTAAGLIGGLTTATATIRSLTVITCNGKTILSTMTHGIILLSLVLGLAPLATAIPLASLAAILFKVGWDILDWRFFPVLHRVSRTDQICFWSTFLVTMTVDLLVAVGIGLSIAFFRFVKEMSELGEPQMVSLQDPKDPYPGSDSLSPGLRSRIGVVQPEGPLFFGVADKVYRTSEFFGPYEVVIISLKRVPVMDISGAFALDDLIEYALNRKTKVLLTEMTKPIQQQMENFGILKKIGQQACSDSFNEALQQAKNLLHEKDRLSSLPEVSEPQPMRPL
jgi:SulP family sulfate permease